MDYPPIPRSVFFHAFPGGYVMFETNKPGKGHTEICEYLDSVPDRLRPIIAAVAEVEWLKRGERWHKLWSRVADRYLRRFNGTSAHHRHTLQYQLDRTVQQQERCDEMAEAWREWGAQHG